MIRALLLAALVLAGCASAPLRERLEVRHAAPGEPLLDRLLCVSVEIGAPCRIVVRNERDEDRAIVWFAEWRTADGYVLKGAASKVREVIVPAGKEATLVAEPPGPEAKQFELWAGDRP